MTRQRLISSVSLALLLSLATLVVLTRHKSGAKVSVSFVNAEPSYGPPFSYQECERLAFAVRNDGTKPVPFVISDIQDQSGTWFPSFQILDEAAARRTTHLYLYLPQGSHPQAVRMRGYKNASALEKAKYALSLLSKKRSGLYPGKQVWFPKLSVPAYDFIVKTQTNSVALFIPGNQSNPDPAPALPGCSETVFCTADSPSHDHHSLI